MDKKELEKLTANPEAFVKEMQDAHATALAEKDSVIEGLNAQLAKMATTDNRGVIEGKFQPKNGNPVKFKKGFTVVRFDGEVYQSADLISNKELAPVMERLIEIGYGGFEEVKSSKK